MKEQGLFDNLSTVEESFGATVPVIRHKFDEVIERAKLRIEGCNIENQIASADSVKTLKTLKADLNKEFKEFDAQRISIKKKILAPYDAFIEGKYSEFKSLYGDAIEMLDDKVTSYENTIRADKEKEWREYFEELRVAAETKLGLELNFIVPEKCGVKVNISTTLSSMKKITADFFTRIESDIETINLQPEHLRSDILSRYSAEYNLNLSIQGAKQAEEQQAQAKRNLLKQKLVKRESILLGIGLVKSEQRHVFYYPKDERVFASYEDAKELCDISFKEKCEALQESISAMQKPEVLPKPKQVDSVPDSKKDPVPTEEPILEVQFVAKGTKEQLVNLINFSKEAGVTLEEV